MGSPPQLSTAARGVLLVASSLTVMAGAIVAAAIPAIAVQFAAVPNAAEQSKLILSWPGLAIAVCGLAAGVLVDRLGRRKVLLLGLGLYALAGGSGVVLNTLDHILYGRLVLGVGVALVMTAATTLINDYLFGEARARFSGLQAMAMALGGGGYVPLGGGLAKLDWHAPFWIYLVALPLAVVAYFVVPEPDRRPGETVVRREDATDIPWPIVGLLYLVGFVGMTAFALVPMQSTFLTAERYGFTGLESGLVVAGNTFLSALVGFQYGRIAKWTSAPWLLTIMFAGLGVCYSTVNWLPDRTPTLGALVVSGFASGLLLPTLSTWLGRVSPVAVRGRLAGGLMSAIFLGQFVSPVAAKPFVLAGGTGRAFEAAGWVLFAFAVVFGLGSVLTTRRENPKNPENAREN